jgi:signal transduction histidine kinase
MAGYLFAAACVVLLCACYMAGRAALPPRWMAAVAIGGLCVPAAQLAIRPVGPASAGGFIAAYLVFALLPLLAGRYVAVQRKAAEQAGLRERLGIARDMHDSLGRSLSLAAVQAAALEVSDLPEPQRAAVARLATAVRATANDLHEIVGVLRSDPPRVPGMSATAALIEEFRAAGVAVASLSSGTRRPLPTQIDETAYRVIEEGLTNAVRHAPGQPVNVTIAWEAAELLLTVVNEADCRAYTPGSGLTDLDIRLRQVGGALVHEADGGMFRLCAALPAAPTRRTSRRLEADVLGLAVGILLLALLPAAILLGVR